MENQRTIEIEKQKNKKSKVRSAQKSKKSILLECISALLMGLFGLMLCSTKMVFGTHPLAFALLAASTRHAIFILLGVILGSFADGFSPAIIVGACAVIALRTVASLFLDNARKKEGYRTASGRLPLGDALASIFSEHIYLRVMSGALGVFIVGVWRIVEGGFRFYDLFASIFYLTLTPVAIWLFSHFFNIQEQQLALGQAFSMSVNEQRLYDISSLALSCALVFSLGNASAFGISLPIFVGVIIALRASKKNILYGIIAGLLLGFSYSPELSPMLALCAVAYSFISKLSLLGGAVASCIAGLLWGFYVQGFFAIANLFPALLCSSVVFCTAEKLNVFDDIKRFISTIDNKSEELSISTLLAEQKIDSQDERFKSISDSFSSLSEVFYNLSSRLKRPSMLDLRAICEESFKKHCDTCDNREVCFGTEYSATLNAMKKMTVLLHSAGTVDEKKLLDSFKKRCPKTQLLVDDINRSCSIATKKAFQNEKVEIFALDFDAISKILNDAIAENDEDFKIDAPLSRKISSAIADEGYGEHNAVAFGKRKLKIIARGLDLSEKSSDVGKLKKKLEDITSLSLTDPVFELAFGSVNMQIEARRAFSVDSAFATATSDGERVCGDTVSIFENKNDLLYALISDGMGTGKNAALTSELCSVFLRNMLIAGNRMETSLRMLNSVLRVKGSKSESECSATVDLLQFDMYSGKLTLVKSGAAPTFVLRRENVFKLASPSFPIGILRALDAKQMDLACEDGDIIVMMSDGATRGGDDCPYIADLLRDPKLADESPSKIADKIIRRAKSEIDPPCDDISVVVLKIRKDVVNWDLR